MPLTLSDLNYFFQKFKTVLGLAILALILGVVLLIFFTPKEPPPVPRLRFEKAANVIFKPGRLTVKDQKLQPKEAAVYQIARLVLDQYEVENLAQKLQLSGPPQIVNDQETGQIFLFKKEGTSLTISQTTISFKKTVEETKGGGVTIKPQEAFFRAKAFLANLALWNDRFFLDAAATRYYNAAGSELTEERDPLKAHLVELNFKTQIDSHDLVGLYPQSAPLTIRLSGSGEIVFFRLKRLPEVKAFRLYPLKSFTEASNEVEQGRGTVVRVFRPGDDPLTSPHYTVASFNLTNVELVYFLPQNEKDQLQPIFLFHGEAILVDGSRSEAAVYLQAVKKRLVKP